MDDASDTQWLTEYGRHGSEEAFAALVRRHINLVYSTALCRVENSAHAEEITQAVFVILARKARSLRADSVLEAWLYETTRLTSLRFLRTERRRQFREQEAYMQSTLQDTNDAAIWNQLAPLLEDAMARLGTRDREAVVLRYFKDKSFREVADKLRINESAAQRRVLRAVEKLRRFFTRRGIVLSTAALTAAISAHSVQAAPATLAGAATAAALAKGAAAGGSTLTLVKGALKIMAWTKVKMTVVAGVVVILAAGTTTVVIKNYRHHWNLGWTSADMDAFRQESSTRINQSKQMALACIIFADDHQSQLPNTMEQLTSVGVVKNGFSDANWELVSGGKLDTLANPSKTILLREKEYRQGPDGRFHRIYAFADGHCASLSAPDNDFAALEKKSGLLIQAQQ